MAMRAQLPRPGVAAGTGLVDDLQRFGLPSRPSGFDSAPHCGGTVPTKRGSWRPLGATPIAMESTCVSKPTKEVIVLFTVCRL